MNQLVLFNNQISDSNQNMLTTDIIVDDSSMSLLEDVIISNERLNKPTMDQLTDEAVIYYFVHKRKHVRKSKNRSSNSKIEYSRVLLQFYNYLKQNKEFFIQDVSEFNQESLLKNLRPRHIKAYQEYLSTAPLGRKGKPYSAATLDFKSTVIKSFLKYLYECSYIDHPLHAHMLSTAISKDEIPNRDLYYHEVKQILDFYESNPITHGILTTLSMTGLRIQEISKAKMKDLYYDPLTGQYRLRGVGKGDKPFDCLIHLVNFERIMLFRKRRRMSTSLDPTDDSPLFATQKRKHYTNKNLSNFVIREIEKTKLPFLQHRESKITPHSFRHFFAIYSRQMGADILEIQQALHHQDRRTTERYLEKVLEREKEVAARWNPEKF
ncbi:tyrosine-type recombinase/integrase [Bacillus haynesii]|uniref:tyrosine-type recombinase/integrase n=1 Tax=Bacillus TaxID=1386 RepID=UPI0035D8C0D2